MRTHCKNRQFFINNSSEENSDNGENFISFV